MYQVVKRDGKIASFDISKISTAITKAFEATRHGVSIRSIIDLLALRVTADYQAKIQDGKITVEDIQDSVEDSSAARQAMPTWPRPTFSTASSGRRSAT